MKNTLIGLTMSLVITILWAPLTALSYSGPPLLTCQDAWQIEDVKTQFFNATDASSIVTEIYEPIGSFEQKIKSGEITVSQVFWKFNCLTLHTREWRDTNGDDEFELTSVDVGKPLKTSGYVPYQDGCPEDAQCTVVQLIVGQSGTGILKTYVALIYRWAASVVGIVAVLVIVISGIQISMDQGSGEGVTAAKNRIMQSLAGLVILFLSALILYTINPTFFTK